MRRRLEIPLFIASVAPVSKKRRHFLLIKEETYGRSQLDTQRIEREESLPLGGGALRNGTAVRHLRKKTHPGPGGEGRGRALFRMDYSQQSQTVQLLHHRHGQGC